MKTKLWALFCIVTAAIISHCSHVKASDTLELVGPGLTMHVIDNDGVSAKYSNKISDNGRLIYTPQLGLRRTHVDKFGTYDSLVVFAARNSIGSPIYGGFGATGAEFFHFFDAGLIYGGYIQNNNDFRAQGIEPFSMTGNTNAFVPLLGIELNVKFSLDNNVFLGLNNLITPIITNSNLSVGYKF